MKYLDSLLNERQVKRFFMLATFVLGAAYITTLALYLRNTGDPSQRLIPQDWAAADGPLEVTASGRESAAYIAHIAVGDTRYLTNWTPETVRDQHARFANRLCPAFFATQRDELMRIAKAYADDDRSQEMHISRVHGGEDGMSATIHGQLRHFDGAELVHGGDTRWTLRYRYDTPGLPCIASMEEDRL